MLDANAPYRALYNRSLSARLLDPRAVQPAAGSEVPAADLALLVSTFYDETERAAITLKLREELLQYRAMQLDRTDAPAAKEEAPNMPLAVWWSHADCAKRIPGLRDLFVKVATVQPSSCSVERFFSVAKHVLSSGQTNSLPDLIRYNVIRNYNKDF